MSKSTDLAAPPENKAIATLPHTQTDHPLKRHDSRPNETMMETIVDGEYVAVSHHPTHMR